MKNFNIMLMQQQNKMIQQGHMINNRITIKNNFSKDINNNDIILDSDDELSIYDQNEARNNHSCLIQSRLNKNKITPLIDLFNKKIKENKELNENVNKTQETYQNKP